MPAFPGTISIYSLKTKNMKHLIRLVPVALTLLGLCLGSCNQQTAADATPPKAQINPTDPNAERAERKAGTYCFGFKHDNHSIEGRLELSAANAVTGTLKGSIVNETDGTDFVYDTSFDGNLDGDSLRVKVLSSATGSKEQTQATWIWNKDGLLEGEHLLTPRDCVN
jgi:hypothetical protein